jgi:hypothetical protein
MRRSEAVNDSTAKHALMGGKLHVYRRENSGQWQCSTYLAGKNRRVSTKTESLSHAKDFAQDWYLELHGKFRRGEVKAEKTFKEAAAAFEREYESRRARCRNIASIVVKRIARQRERHCTTNWSRCGRFSKQRCAMRGYRISPI